MILCETTHSLKSELAKLDAKNKSVGFVPTMGALHDGHLSLLDACIKNNEISVVSIFVNPTQFNNPADLEKYPRDLQSDLNILQPKKCDIVFAPTVEDIYENNQIASSVVLGKLGEVMEGKFRPGHFEGVMQIVELLFRIVQPQNAYFGRKDFQQVAVIKHMVKTLNISTKIIECETMREKSGLAMSSRNKLLTSENLKDAAFIFAALSHGRKLASSKTPAETKEIITKSFSESKLSLEYISIVDPTTLESLDYAWTPGATACVVAYCGAVRLLDNLELIPALQN
ncbi:MAG: pantoate--beta-alanine ligase [Bacteroidetes bacterium]|nr:pantoate--beta-alanine ligase [Bacteroidota bacterium]